jgi:RND family efflux transporter MFP subunit
MTALFRRFTFWLAVLGLTGLVLLVRASTTTPPMPEPPVAPPVKPFASGLGASGLVEALRENTSVGVALPGLVAEVAVEVWQRVEKGDVLLRLDDREVRAQLTGLRAELAVREAELQRSTNQQQRIARLDRSRVASREEVEKAEDDLRVARANTERARAAIAQVELLLERFTIRAPIAGTVLQVNARVGEYATPTASTPPLILGSIDELQVRADVDEQLAPRVQPGARAVAYRKGDTREPIPLEFVRIEPFIIPKKNLTGSSAERVDTRVLQVIYRFQNTADRRAYVGQQVDVFIEETIPSESRKEGSTNVHRSSNTSP